MDANTDLVLVHSRRDMRWEDEYHGSYDLDVLCELFRHRLYPETDKSVPDAAIEFIDNVGYEKRLGWKVRDLAESHREWSNRTFGDTKVRDYIGPLMHLKKEIEEILAAPTDYSEWSDALLLLLDAARRAGLEIEDYIDHTRAKLVINKSRKWNIAVPGQPCEHIKEENE